MYDVRAGPGSVFLQRSNGKHACHGLAMIDPELFSNAPRPIHNHRVKLRDPQTAWRSSLTCLVRRYI
jgi:hypothetical protein